MTDYPKDWKIQPIQFIDCRYQPAPPSPPPTMTTTVTEIHDQLDLDRLPAWTNLTLSVNDRPFAGFVWTGDHLVDPTTAARVDLRYLVHQYGPLLVLA